MMPKRPWSTADFAYWGAFLGMGIGAAHGFWHIFEGSLPPEHPILHFLLGEVASTLGAASLLAGIAGLHNRLVRA